MLRGGAQTGAGLRLRVYEVCADGRRRDLAPAVHTYGSRPVPAPVWEPRRNTEQNVDRAWAAPRDDG